MSRPVTRRSILAGGVATIAGWPAISEAQRSQTIKIGVLSDVSGSDMLEARRKKCFILAADYAFGHLLEQQTRRFMEKGGAQIVGSVRYPFPATTDFSSFLLQAQSSGADVLALATAGADTIANVK